MANILPQIYSRLKDAEKHGPARAAHCRLSVQESDLGPMVVSTKIDDNKQLLVEKTDFVSVRDSRSLGGHIRKHLSDFFDRRVVVERARTL